MVSFDLKMADPEYETRRSLISKRAEIVRSGARGGIVRVISRFFRTYKTFYNLPSDMR